MATVTDYLIQLQDLTKTNLQILQGLNDSFFSKENHLNVKVDDVNYIIPSYIALENKINALQEGFNNLVNAPKTGEAFFNFDGNSKAIEVRGYNTTPMSISLDTIYNFDYEKNNIFKDFLSPKPFVSFNLDSIPDDITSVNVKKIIPINNDLVNLFKSNLTKVSGGETGPIASKQFSYADLYKILSLYNKDIDYTEYDTVMKMPIRKNIGHATYAIESILDDITTEALEEIVTLKIRSSVNDSLITTKLNYKLFDETIDVPLAVGDQLITYSGNAKLEIVEIQYNTNVIKVKVLNGDFTNFVPSNNDDSISDYSKLRFFKSANSNIAGLDKTIKVPLEEDQYIFIAVAPLNDRMNIQSSWGSGLMINTYELKNNSENFNDYYKENVNNIGDVLYELTSVSTNGITKYSEAKFKEFTQYKPIIKTDDLKVIQINSHLNDSEVVKNIKSLYDQKMRLNNELVELQKNITTANETLSKINFEDTTGRRSDIMANLSNWEKERNEKIIAVNKLIDEISISATNADVPIENAKYRIRGYFDFSTINSLITETIDHIMGINVQYRYKNISKSHGTAMSINDKFIFSDWNIMKGFNSVRKPSYKGGKIIFKLEDSNDKLNEPSCNQIDIPISQGETVDIKLQVVYDFGAPYIETTSDWSDIVSIDFPIEFTKDVQVLDIIKENNNDIETNRFNNILLDTGTSAHVNDRLIDQDLVYFHKPDSISSGFVTPERRIIPLKDKLIDMDKLINELSDIVKGSTSESLSINISNGDNMNTILPWQDNIIGVSAYNSFNTTTGNNINTGVYEVTGHVIQTILNINIVNTSNHIVNLYSLFPGDSNTLINDVPKEYLGFDKNNYIDSIGDEKYEKYKHGVWMAAMDKELTKDNLFLQKANQYITFRTNLINNINGKIYATGKQDETVNKLSSSQEYTILQLIKDKYGRPDVDDPEPKGMWMCPIIKNDKFLNIDNINNSLGKAIKPGEQITIPILVQYNMDGTNTTTIFKKTMSFDLRTSLYTDPISYKFTVVAKKIETIQDKVLAGNNKNNIKYTPSIK